MNPKPFSEQFIECHKRGFHKETIFKSLNLLKKTLTYYRYFQIKNYLKLLNLGK